VISSNQRRGAEMFASQLIEFLNGTTVSQRVAVLNGSENSPLSYQSPTEIWKSDGWMSPGLRINARTLLRLRKLISSWSPDLIQAHGGEALKYALLASHGRNTRVIYRKIGTIAPWATRGPRRIAYAVLMRRAACVITTAEALRKETIRLFGVPPHKVVTIPRGVDPRGVEPIKGRKSTRRSLGISETARVILSLGALTWEKDPVAHIELVARVSSQEPEVVHIVAGDGPLRVQVEEAARARGLDGRVMLLGVRSDVGDLLAASDVMLLASRAEGMPGVVIEAGMAGLPVVAYGIAGVPEVVSDGVTGLIANPGDQTILTECMLRLIRDEAARSTMGAAARERCRSRFNVRNIADRYVELYSNLVN
jgi:glycosyltransferase involved in cell wall biosynthesis